MSRHHYKLYSLTVTRIDGSVHTDNVNARDSGEALELFERIEERHNPHGITGIATITIEELNTPTDEE